MASLENEIIARARNLTLNDQRRDPMDCIKQAVKELVSDNTKRDVCAIFDITNDEYLSEAYYNSLYEDYKRLIAKELNIC